MNLNNRLNEGFTTPDEFLSEVAEPSGYDPEFDPNVKDAELATFTDFDEPNKPNKTDWRDLHVGDRSGEDPVFQIVTKTIEAANTFQEAETIFKTEFSPEDRELFVAKLDESDPQLADHFRGLRV